MSVVPYQRFIGGNDARFLIAVMVGNKEASREAGWQCGDGNSDIKMDKHGRSVIVDRQGGSLMMESQTGERSMLEM